MQPVDQSISTLNSKGWSLLFGLLKQNNIPTYDKTMKKAPSAVIVNQHWGLSTSADAETSDSRYRNYINSILSNIRSGNIDYCYYIYQVRDLLRFYPNLVARLVDVGSFKYIEVFLP